MRSSLSDNLAESKKLLLISDFDTLSRITNNDKKNVKTNDTRWQEYYLGYAFFRLGDYHRARAVFRSALLLCDSKNDVWLLALLYLRLAECSESLQMLDETSVYAEKAYELFSNRKDKIGMCRSQFVLGTALLMMNRLDESYELLIRANKIAKKIDFLTCVNILHNIGLLYDIKAETESSVESLITALSYIEKCETINKDQTKIAIEGYSIATHTGYERTSYNVQRNKVNIYGTLSSVLSNAGVYDESLRYAALGIELVKEYSSPLQIAMWCNNLAVNQLELNNYKDAYVLLHEAKSLTDSNQQIDVCGYIALNLGRCELMNMDTDKALEHFETASSIFTQTQNTDEQLTTLYYKSKVYNSQNKTGIAKQILEKAIVIAKNNNLLSLHTPLLIEYGYTKSLLDEPDSVEVLKEAIEISMRYKRRKNYVDALSVLANVYEKMGKTAESLSILKQYVKAYQGLLSDEFANRSQVIATLYGVESLRYKQVALEKQAELDKQLVNHLQFQLTVNNHSILIQMNELNSFRSDVLAIIRQLDKREDIVRKLKIKVRDSHLMQGTWSSYLETFSKVHPDFQATLTSKYRNLTRMEVRICILIKAGLTSEEIAQILSLSARTIENNRLRIRKKLGLEERESLSRYLLGL